MSVIISLTNQKGGVGKTSSALNLGAALNISGMKVLVIDNDPQGNLTAALGYTPAEQSRTLANLLLAAIDYPEDLELHLGRTIIHTSSGLDLFPANRRLADAAARLQVMQLSQYNAVGEMDRACEKVMAALLEPLKSQYDYIIIDCGLKHELLTVNALATSDYCIIPVNLTFWPAKASRTYWNWSNRCRQNSIRRSKSRAFCSPCTSPDPSCARA